MSREEFQIVIWGWCLNRIHLDIKRFMLSFLSLIPPDLLRDLYRLYLLPLCCLISQVFKFFHLKLFFARLLVT